MFYLYNEFCKPISHSFLQAGEPILYHNSKDVLGWAVWPTEEGYAIEIFGIAGKVEKEIIIYKNFEYEKAKKNGNIPKKPLVTIMEDSSTVYSSSSISIDANGDLSFNILGSSIIQKTAKLKNFFKNFFDLSNFTTLEPNFLDEENLSFSIQKWRESKGIDNIIASFGTPHFNCGSCTGNAYLFYFGIHDCKKSGKRSLAFFILVYDKNGNLRQIYYLYESCGECNNKNETVVLKEKNLDFII